MKLLYSFSSSDILKKRESPLQVAAIEPSGRLYGSEYCLLDIIDGLPRRRFSWRIFLPRNAGFDQLLLDRGIGCEFLLPRHLGEIPRWQRSLVYARVLWRLKQLKPDLLYVNQTGSLRAAAVYARWLQLPVICQVQTLEDARWLSSNPRLHPVVKAFICNSEFIAAETLCDPYRKCVLYQGLPPERVEHSKKNRLSPRKFIYRYGEQKPFVVGILGRIAVSKGHYLLINAVTQLQKLLPNCRFVVIGAGLTPKDTHDFGSAVHQSGLTPSFEFRGYRKDLAAEFDRLDLLVIPSLAEPLGRVLFDAAEYGVPVVLSDAGGLGEISRRFDVGVRFKSGDAGALSRSLFEVARNYQKIRQRFLAASLIMLERLSMPSYLSTIERILLSSADCRTSCEVWLGDETGGTIEIRETRV
jgi:glycosyltransferase involved in cell wall biosynthesis